ncbi:hypothetical protein [Janthinobacterium agaricidamnosum]|uniref:Transmembrane protein n=1 Tax=Janthinobacterium agaricidamnosum NBRC 102515 = DSM 9628 TaxID=1349767 RepID=W0VDY2_9BURK|nr:hypothetical protein [Janthinobacterium agaricidamnosum]CDG85880.1 hypothetical protein GJA_5284 [Janthinobacterium agaricidamnosum NBRC 102515 = DSM 9628]
MSTFISAFHASALPLQAVSPAGVIEVVLGSAALLAFVLLFRPLLVGIARALVLVVKPKLSREQRLAKMQMRDA